MIIDILFFHCSFVDMLNIISTCQDILCVNINVDKRCVDHSTRKYPSEFTVNANIYCWIDVSVYQIECALVICVFTCSQGNTQLVVTAATAGVSAEEMATQSGFLFKFDKKIITDDALD